MGKNRPEVYRKYLKPSCGKLGSLGLWDRRSFEDIIRQQLKDQGVSSLKGFLFRGVKHYGISQYDFMRFIKLASREGIDVRDTISELEVRHSDFKDFIDELKQSEHGKNYTNFLYREARIQDQVFPRRT